GSPCGGADGARSGRGNGVSCSLLSYLVALVTAAATLFTASVAGAAASRAGAATVVTGAAASCTGSVTSRVSTSLVTPGTSTWPRGVPTALPEVSIGTCSPAWTGCAGFDIGRGVVCDLPARS